MRIAYSTHLDTQTFIEAKNILQQLGEADATAEEHIKLGAISNPILAFDREGIAALPRGELIAGLFGHPQLPLVSEYENTRNAWFKYPGTWPAAIDTLIHLYGQRVSAAAILGERILDIGCGTGMAGAHAANHSRAVKEVDFTDINPHATVSARENSTYFGRKDVQYNALQGNAFAPTQGKYDCIIASAVPATPLAPHMHRPHNPLFEGTSFLEEILCEAPERLTPGGKLLISHSSVGENAFNKAAAIAGATVDAVHATKEVPFREEFLGSQPWIDYLVAEGGLKAKNERGYPYWHTITVKEVSYR